MAGRLKPGWGRYIKEARDLKKWNQTELAYHAGLAPSVISQIENGKRDPTARTLRKLAAALDVEVGDLFPKGQPTLPLDLEQRREYAQRLMDAGVSEATSRSMSGEYSRSEEYWRALAKYAGLESGPSEAGTAEKLIGFGGRMVAWWESELPKRLEAEDQEWLDRMWARYHEFTEILDAATPGESSNRQERSSGLMDIHAAALRILAAVHFHNARSREAGKKELVLAQEQDIARRL